MHRIFCTALILVGVLEFVSPGSASAQWDELPLIFHEQAEQVGLKRAWYTQLPLDIARSKVKYVTFQSDLRRPGPDDNMLHVVDPESGLLQWSFKIGQRKFVPLSAGANANFVAVANTARLFVLDRAGGNLVFNHALSGTPDRGPVLTENHVILPLVNGPLEVYPLDQAFEKLLSPYYLPSAGRMIGEVAAVNQGVAWAGDLNLINAHQFREQGPHFSNPV